MKINQIAPQDNPYLQVLGDIAKSPEVVYYLGTLPAERRPTVSIVGSRKPTAYGHEVTTRFAGELARAGFVVVSGLALGIDAIAHRAALDVGGTTIGVLANGLPAIYPSTNHQLAHNIVDNGGAIISEYPTGTSAKPFRFLQRNRLVSGLSDVVLVTEAAARSGTLNTVMHALEQGKEVCVVPGNITSPMSSGCNALIRQGATPVTEPAHIIELAAPDLAPAQTVMPLGTTPAETVILTLLSQGIRHGDELQARAGLDASEFSMTMTMLELAGTIRALGGGQWTLR